MKTIRDNWKEYFEAVVHPEASPAQIEDMERAFWAGVVSTMSVITQGASDEEEISQLANAEGIRQVVLEIHNFNKLMQSKGENPNDN